MEQVDPSGWTRVDYIEFYTEVLGCSILPFDKNKKPLVHTWKELKTRANTPEELERCLHSWGVSIVLKNNLFCIDFDLPEAYELFKGRIPTGALIAKTPHGYHAALRSSTTTETIKGGNKEWIAHLESIDPLLIELIDAEGNKKAKIDILGEGSLLYSPDSPGYKSLGSLREPATVSFAQTLLDVFGFTHRALPRITNPVRQGDATQWTNIFCPWCESSGKHASASCSIDLAGGGYICHGSCERKGKLTELIEYAKQIQYTLPQAVYDWEREFKKRNAGAQMDNKHPRPQSIQEFMSNVKMTPPLIHGLASRGELIMLYGTTGVGKSSFLEYLTVCACAGISIADIFLMMHPLKCLFLDTQMAPAEIGTRCETLLNKLGGHESFTIMSLSDWDITKPGEQQWLYDTVKQGGYDLVALDPFEDIHHLNENDNSDMARVVAPLRKIANELNCAVFVGHHTGGDQYDNMGKMLPKKPRGATAITDRMDTIIQLINTNDVYERRLHFGKMRKALTGRPSDILLRYDPETLLMSLGGPAALQKAYKQGAKDRYETLNTLEQIKTYGMTDEQIAQKVEVVRSTVTRWHSGIRMPDATAQKKLGALFKELQGKMVPEGGTNVPVTPKSSTPDAGTSPIF